MNLRPSGSTIPGGLLYTVKQAGFMLRVLPCFVAIIFLLILTSLALATALVACDSGNETPAQLESEKSAAKPPATTATEHEITLVAGCSGCHGTDDLAVPADYPDADPERVVLESAAAAHMYSNGGTADPTAVLTTECLTCHGEGRIADPAITHDLIQFRPLPVDPNE